jgi:NADPH-dependent 2,4-dienoyl-CoA reductase/sulfur reductase-like enzyme
MVDGREAAAVDVEPVEIAVEHEHGTIPFGVHELEDALDRMRIAVDAAGDVQRIGLDIGGARERRRRVAIGDRAGALRARLRAEEKTAVQPRREARSHSGGARCRRRHHPGSA